MKSTVRAGGGIARQPAALMAVAAFFGANQAAMAQQSESTSRLGEVVVTAAGFEQQIKEAPASITVITQEQLKQSRVSSIAEAVANVEGVDVGDSVGKTGGMNISMRGMPSDYTLILIDGRRQNAAGNVTPNGFGETSTSFLPPVSAIERIEIIRGPMSTLYGSDAMGGVINIITRKVGKEWAGSLTVEGTLQQESEFGNSSGLTFYVSGPLVKDTLGLTVRGNVFRRSASDITYVDHLGAEVAPWMGGNPVEAKIKGIGARLTLTPNRNHDIWLDIDQARQTYDNSSGQLGTLGTGGYAEKQRYNRDQYTLAHTARLGWGLLESSLMYNTTETVGRLIPPGQAGAGSPRVLEVENLIFDSKLVTQLGRHMLTGGLQWWDAKMVDGVAPAPYKHEQWALFVEDEWRFVDSMALTLGARYDDHSVFGGHVSPRAYLVWNANQNWTVKGGIAGGYKTPRLDQLAAGITGFGGQGRIPLIGSPGLKPETSLSGEVGVLYDNQAGTTASATLFNNRFKDKIASGPGLLNCSYGPSPNRTGCVDFGNWPNVDVFGQSVNVDRAITRGIELGTQVPLAPAWMLSANYTFTDSEQQSGAGQGRPLSNTPRHMFNAKLTWQTTDKLTTWLRGEYRSKRIRNLTNSTNAAYNALGDYKAYGLLHVGASYQFSKNVTLNATIYNLLNKDFLEYTVYPDPTAADPGRMAATNVYNNNQEGRRLWLSATMTF